jgi:hypothetical protein
MVNIFFKIVYNKTENYFFKVVTRGRVHVIICTQTKTQNRIKCLNYWPK